LASTPAGFAVLCAAVLRPGSAGGASQRIFGYFEETRMNWDLVERNWKQFRGTVKARWAMFDDAHLDAIGGKRAALLGQIQAIYGVKRSDAEKEIKIFEARNKDYRPKNRD
jgi:uncharacterized protein YjbJ (UPF0337 family)